MSRARVIARNLKLEAAAHRGWKRRGGGNGGIAHLLGGNGLLASLAKLLDGLLVVTQILLAADQDDGQSLAEM